VKNSTTYKFCILGDECLLVYDQRESMIDNLYRIRWRENDSKYYSGFVDMRIFT